MSSAFIQSITCENVRTLSPYESARRLYSGGQFWLNANESPFSNAYQINSDKLNRYPECQPESLLSAYAAYSQVNPEQVLVSRGADEGIELLIRAFCEPGKDNIVICPPTYGMYAISAETCNVGILKAPLTNEFTLDFDALESIAAQTNPPKLVFLCSPNNPTGSSLSPEQITRCLALFQGKSLVVLDEAYIEFSWDKRWSDRLEDFDNLVILRTLSKAFALAGIRCGFTLASEEVIATLLKVIAPYPIAEPVKQIAIEALSQSGVARMREQVAYLQAQQATLKQRLAAVPSFEMLGSDDANFLLYRINEKDALMTYLVDNGMLIRDQSKQMQLQNCLRVSIGNDAENERLLSLITQFYQKESL